MSEEYGKVSLTTAIFSGIKVFQSLPLKSRESLITSLHGRRYSAKQVVVSQHDESSDVHCVVTGNARATMFSTTGKEVSFQDLGAGEMFGELAAIDGQPRATHVITLCDSIIASMSSEVFWTTLKSHPEVASAVLRRLSSLVRLHCDRIFEFSTLGVKNRIHAELLRLARDQPQSCNSVIFTDVPTHTEIANRVSTHREAVTRELKHLEANGLIEWRPGQHVICDIYTLERMVKEVRGK